MKIVGVSPQPNWFLTIVSEDGRIGSFDVNPYLDYVAFSELKSISEFKKVSNGGYFIMPAAAEQSRIARQVMI